MRGGRLLPRRRLAAAAAALALALLAGLALLPRLAGIGAGDLAALAAARLGLVPAAADGGYALSIDRDGTKLDVRAGSGTLDPARQRLKLGGGIEMIGHGGYRLQTDRADIDLVGGKVTGDAPIAASGPDGSIAADHFSVDDHGRVLRFGGRVRVTLTPPTSDHSQENPP